jgi:RNA polymerase sigma-70 factor (ECF subfamily)
MHFLDASPIPMSSDSSISSEIPVLSMASPSLSQWFMAEVWPHEAALRAYIRVRFPSLTDIDNIIQETFARVLRAHGSGGVRSPKALLFSTARNAALDQLRHERVIPIESIANIEALSVFEDRSDAVETLSREQELQLLEQAVRSLPGRCQEILILKKIEGLSYAEIGMKLGISPNTISAQLTLGVLRCRRFLAERGVFGGRSHE